MSTPQIVRLGSTQGTLQRSPKEIADYILSHNVEHRLDSALYWNDNFNLHIQRLVDAGQMILFLDGDEIRGACGWACVNKAEGINKIRWELPENITSGRILYITLCVLDEKSNMFLVKKFFEDIGMRDKIDRVFWYNSVKRKVFNMEVK